MSEVKVVVQRGPRAGSVFTLAEGRVGILGDDDRLAWRLPGIAARAAVFRNARRLEVQLLCEAALNGQPCRPGTWIELQPGDRLEVGEHELGVEDPRSTAVLEPPAGFVIESELGRGGFGVVYEAIRERDGLRVALKVLPWARPSHLKRFRREGATCLALDHPAIARVLELGTDAEPPWIALEYVPGSDAARLVREGPLGLEEAISIGADVAGALAWLAERDLVHRDVKLENVLVTPEGAAKLTDFGLVKDLSQDLIDLTKSGVAMGTLVYAAPEQLEDAKSVGPPSDVYGLGVTLFGLLGGRLPWEIDSSEGVAATLAATPRDLRELRPEVPNLLARLVASTLERDPARRPSARDVERLLRQLI